MPVENRNQGSWYTNTDCVDMQALMEHLGTVVPTKVLRRHLTKREIAEALRCTVITRPARGVYALPLDDAARAAATRLNGTVVLLSAAVHWGFAVQWSAKLPQVAVPKGRTVAATRRKGIDVRWRDIPDIDRVGWVTSRVRTVLDCAVLLPFAEALAVADSALRSGKVTREELEARVAELPRQHRGRVATVIRHADARAANPFESVLRAIALDVPGLRVVPQVRLGDADGFIGTVDLHDGSLGIVLEAESLEFHGDRYAFDKDCERYTRLACDGALVLRFTWTQVMHNPDWVRGKLQAAVALRTAQRASRGATRSGATRHTACVCGARAS